MFKYGVWLTDSTAAIQSDAMLQIPVSLQGFEHVFWVMPVPVVKYTFGPCFRNQVVNELHQQTIAATMVETY